MQSLKVLGLVSLFAVSVACTSTDANGNPQSIMAAIPGSIALPLQVADDWSGESEEKTSASGEVLFQQEAYLLKSYRVAATIEGITANPFGVKYEITPETVLYPALTGRYGTVYCTRDVEAKEMFGTRHRVCLRDSDGDEAMDQVWTTDEMGSSDGHLGIYVMKTEKTIEPAVSLTEVEAPETDRETFGVRYTYSDPWFGAPELVFRVVREKADGSFDASGTGLEVIKINDTTQFPQTVLVDTALIQVTGFDDKAISYKVLDGFTAGSPLFAIRPRVPQTVYVYY